MIQYAKKTAHDFGAKVAWWTIVEIYHSANRLHSPTTNVDDMQIWHCSKTQPLRCVGDANASAL